MILMMIFITIDEHVEGIQQRVRPGLVEDDSKYCTIHGESLSKGYPEEQLTFVEQVLIVGKGLGGVV